MPYKNPEDDRQHAKRYYRMHKKKRKHYSKEWRRKLRIAVRKEALDHYGGPVCVCCGETTYAFLTLDHKNNDGAKLRKQVSAYRCGGAPYLYYLKRHGWPDVGIQVLCWNCNCGRAVNGGICPHKQST